MSWEVRQGDCVEAMQGMEAASIDAVVCDPPYGLEFMGKEWDRLWREAKASDNRGGQGTQIRRGSMPDSYVAGAAAQTWHQAWATEALRVLKPGGHLLAFGGTRTFHRLTCAIEDAGFEIRDCLSWLYGSGFPKSHNLNGEYKGWGTALKPAWEPIVLARKPLVGTVAQNVLEHGTGALNIDATRIESNGDHKRGFVGAAPGRNVYGDRPRLKEGFQATDADGRWPANLVLDEHAAAELDGQSGESRAGVANPNQNGSEWPHRGRGGQHHPGFNDSGGASRFFYVAKASRRERNAGLEGFEESPERNYSGGPLNRPEHQSSDGVKRSGERNPRANNHPTVKPTALMRWLCRLVTPPNGIILDPFTGSGTTGCAAVLEGFNFIGIEKEPEYVEIAKARIAHWASQEQQMELAA